MPGWIQALGKPRRWFGGVVGRWIESAGQPRRWFGLAIVAALLSATLTAIESVLHDMHLPGSVSATLTELASPLTSINRGLGLLQSWRDWNESTVLTGRFTTTAWLAWWLVIDLVFAAIVAVLVASVGLARGQMLRGDVTRDDNRWGIVSLLWYVPWVALIYLIADWTENVVSGGILIAFDNGVDVRGWLAVLRVVSGLKWLSLVFAVAPIVISYFAFAAEGSAARRRGWNTAMELRPQLIGCGLVVTALAFLPGNVRPQVNDLIVGWSDQDHWRQAVAAVLLVLGLATVACYTGSRTLRRVYPGQVIGGSDISRRRYITVLIAAIILIGLAFLLSAWDRVGAPWLAAAPAGLLVTWLLLSLPDPVREIDNERTGYLPRPGLLRLVVVAPVVALVVAWIRATVPVMDPWRGFFTLVGLMILAASWWLLWRWVPQEATADSADSSRSSGAWLVGVGLVLAVVAGAVVVWASTKPDVVATDVGATALVVLAGCVLLGVLVVATITCWAAPRGPLALIGLHRFPVVSFAVVVVLLVSTLARHPGFHLARVEPPAAEAQPQTRPPEPGAQRGVTVQEAFDAWRRTDPAAVSSGPTPDGTADGAGEAAGLPPTSDTGTGTGDATQPAATDDPTWVPLFIISTSGGGGRSAYWTLLTLDCLFAERPLLADTDDHAPACSRGTGGTDAPAIPDYGQVFAASGISGGSVGVAMYAAAHGQVTPDAVFENGYVDQIVANLLAIDGPNAVIQAPDWQDRAAALERAWERHVPGLDALFFARWAGIRQLGAEDDWDPLLMLNSAAVEDGCRINVSPLSVAAARGTDPLTSPELSGSCRAFPDLRLHTSSADGSSLGWAATRDLNAIMCPDQDVRTSTAALMSARFPYVSPTGGVPFCRQPGRFTFLVDGGTVDSSAAQPAALMLEELVRRVAAQNARAAGPCIQPVVLQLDNGYEDLTTTPFPDRPKEGVAPLTGALAAITNNSSNARQQLAELASNLRQRVGCDRGSQAAPDVPTFLQIYPQSHPGVEAPLGWSLSEASRDDMKDQFTQNANQCSLLTVRYWLTGGTNGWVCAAGTVENLGAAVSEVEVCLGTDQDHSSRTAESATDAFGTFVLLDQADALPRQRGDLVTACDSSGVQIDPVTGSAVAFEPRDRLAFDARYETRAEPTELPLTGDVPVLWYLVPATLAAIATAILIRRVAKRAPKLLAPRAPAVRTPTPAPDPPPEVSLDRPPAVSGTDR